MYEFKNKIAKIVFAVILILVLIFNLITTKSYSATVNVSTESNVIKEDNEFNYNLSFGERIITSDFILEFDENYVEFLGVETDNIEYSKLGKGKVIFVYVDENGGGVESININLKVKSEKFNDDTLTDIQVIEMNAYSLTTGNAYSTEDFDLGNTKLSLRRVKVTEETPVGGENKDNTNTNEENNQNNNQNNDDKNNNQQNNNFEDNKQENNSNIGNNNNNSNNDIENNNSNDNGVDNTNNNNNYIENNNQNNNTNNNNTQDFSNNSNVNADNVGAVDNNNNSNNNSNNNNNNNNNSNNANTNTNNNTSNNNGEIQITTPAETDPKSSDLPFTGKKSSKIATALLIILIIHTIYVFIKSRKNQTNFYIAFLFGLILFTTLDSYATGNIFIKNYDRIKNYENLIVIMPDRENRNIKKSDFITIQKSNDIDIVKVENKKGDTLEKNFFLATNNIAYSNENVIYKILVYGDVNCDGDVTSNDIAEIIVNKLNNVELEGLVRKAANVYNENDLDDKTIDSEDIKILKQYILRTLTGDLVKSLPEELVRSISIVAENEEMEVGEEQQLTINANPSDMIVDDIEWSSNDEEVLTVDENGVVTAKASGTAYITAISKSDTQLNDTILITVADVVTGVKMQIKQIELEVGDIRRLAATVLPPTAKNKEVLWSTSNAKIVSVDMTGRITANNEGTAIIKVTTQEGKFVDTCEVIVHEENIVTRVETNVTGIVINKTATTLKKGETEKLSAYVVPGTAMFQTVSWKSSNPDIVTVDQDGNIKGVSSGVAVITVTSDDGGFTAECVVTVNKIAVTGISLNKTNITLEHGEKENIVAYIAPYNATNKEVVWGTSNALVATVVDGEVTAVGTGIATISARTKDGGYLATCTVIVNPVRVTGIELDRVSVVVYVDQTVKVTATIYPTAADNKDVVWESNNEDIFVVDNFGNITGINKGTAKLTAKTVDGNHKATCNVIVLETEKNVEEVTLNRDKITINEGQSEKLIATILPADATNKNVTWTSSNPAVAEVDSDGNVTAKSEGLAVITVRTQDGYKNAKCEVTVNKVPKPVIGVTLNKITVILNEGENETLIATINPIDADNKNVRWSSTNTRVVEVDSNGKITAKALGTANVMVTTEDGGKVATCYVIVNKASKPVNEVRLNKDSITLDKDESEVLLATIEPADADNQNVTWITSDSSVAIVDSNGRVTGKGAGTATITVRTEDGNKTATCEVTVRPREVSSIELNKTSIALGINEEESLVATINPNDADNKNVTWRSSNTSVATVDENGKVTGKGAGRTTITVTTQDGNKTATCEVLVISVELSTYNIDLEVDEKADLSIIVNPGDIPGTKSWNIPSYDSSLIKVEKNETWGNLEIEALKSGNTELRFVVTINEKEFELSCNIIINGSGSEEPEEPEESEKVSVTLDKSIVELNVDESCDVRIIVNPSQGMEYEISNITNVIEVQTYSESDTFTIKGKNAGTVELQIKVTVGEEVFNLKCNVTVKGSGTEEVQFTFDRPEVELTVGDSTDVNIILLPEQFAGVSGEITNSDVIDVQTYENSSRITITAKKAGTAQLIMKVIIDGKEYQTTCDITVNAAAKMSLLKRLLSLF